ncbi:hypothetical protein CAEBREN_18220 [Caenorhabditis brenneri]|uniref:Chromo domain-containing protein n=1 Tax=Caenorhabditis brenneri TaxID=135651 RepID=G0P3V2_CAEBE|nr:hypothetical protein CAEBREN_18220 [Caenorhabditis brenneri]
MLVKNKKTTTVTTVQVVDTELYEIEKIVNNALKGNTIHYTIKWKDYSSAHDTSEAEYRMNCDEKLVQYARSLIKKGEYIDKMPSWISNLAEVQKNRDMILRVVDPVTTFAQTTIHCGSVKFVDMDTVGSKIMLLEFLHVTNHQHLLHSAVIPSEDTLDRDAERYTKELNYRLKVFSEHPFVYVEFPQTPPTTVFYAPPPLSALLFEPITMEMLEENRKDPMELEHLVVAPSMDPGFNKSKVFLDSEYIQKKRTEEEDPRFWRAQSSTSGALRVLNGMDRIHYPSDPRFHVNLRLRQALGYGWYLAASHEVPPDTPLLMMTGVITPVEVAHETLLKYGERCAFSSFIEIPGTGMCLDRRNYYDLSKFISHNCRPTCAVRLVESGNEFPDLVVYSRMPIDRSIDFELSLDFYKGFRAEVNKFFKRNKPKDGKPFTLFEKSMDFVECRCADRKCREVLYVDRSRRATDKDARKTEKLSCLEQKFKFGGLAVHESKKIWRIRNGDFVG